MQNESVDIVHSLEKAAGVTPSSELGILAHEACREIRTLRNMIAAYELAFNRLLQVQIAMLGDKVAVEDGMIIDANQDGYPKIGDWNALLDGMKDSDP